MTLTRRRAARWPARRPGSSVGRPPALTTRPMPARPRAPRSARSTRASRSATHRPELGWRGLRLGRERRRRDGHAARPGPAARGGRSDPGRQRTRARSPPGTAPSGSPTSAAAPSRASTRSPAGSSRRFRLAVARSTSRLDASSSGCRRRQGRVARIDAAPAVVDEDIGVKSQGALDLGSGRLWIADRVDGTLRVYFINSGSISACAPVPRRRSVRHRGRAALRLGRGRRRRRDPPDSHRERRHRRAGHRHRWPAGGPGREQAGDLGHRQRARDRYRISRKRAVRSARRSRSARTRPALPSGGTRSGSRAP